MKAKKKATRKATRHAPISTCMTATAAALLLPALALAEPDAGFASTEKLFEHVSESVCTISGVGDDGHVVRRGSGFVLQDSGLLVTNAHVVAGLETATVKCGNQHTNIVSVMRFDPGVDLVVASTGGLDVPGLALSDEISTPAGSEIFVVSSPFGLEGTITPGLASGNRELQGETYLQISASISAGSSGGPVVDRGGRVIGIVTAALEVGQNINFAIPALALRTLPSVSLQLTDLRRTGRAPRVRAPAEQAPVLVQEPEPSAEARKIVEAGTGEFRGFRFGTACGDIAIAEYRRKPASDSRGSIRFSKWYSGPLEFDVSLYGAPATAMYQCDDELGMYHGQYELTGNSTAVSAMASSLQRQFGVGTLELIPEHEASERGCRHNFSLPGSRFYRPSELTTWVIDDRFEVNLLVCGGKSQSAFANFSDPVLAEEAASSEPQRFRIAAR